MSDDGVRQIVVLEDEVVLGSVSYDGPRGLAAVANVASALNAPNMLMQALRGRPVTASASKVAPKGGKLSLAETTYKVPTAALKQVGPAVKELPNIRVSKGQGDGLKRYQNLRNEVIALGWEAKGNPSFEWLLAKKAELIDKNAKPAVKAKPATKKGGPGRPKKA